MSTTEKILPGGEGQQAPEHPRDHIEELVSALTDPIIVFPSPWQETLPEWIKRDMTLHRMAHQMRCLKGEAYWDEATDLEASGALKEGPPVSMEMVQQYLVGQGLEVRYYDPATAPPFIHEAAAGIDEALVPEGSRFFLFINQDRSLNRLRFSFFHGVGHFCLPGHRGLSYLGKGCQVQPLSTRPYERQAHCFAAAMNMPPRLFREDMSSLPFGLRAVENLSQ